jgi:hypothetical protein
LKQRSDSWSYFVSVQTPSVTTSMVRSGETLTHTVSADVPSSPVIGHEPLIGRPKISLSVHAGSEDLVRGKQESSPWKGLVVSHSISSMGTGRGIGLSKGCELDILESQGRLTSWSLGS